MHISSTVALAFGLAGSAFARPASAILNSSREVSQSLFDSLEELARLVDISYCVGSTGIQKPFSCLSRCSDFESFELVTVRTRRSFQVSTLTLMSFRPGILDLFSLTHVAMLLSPTLHILSES